MIGRFLEFSVHAPDVLASIAFYEGLGFVQASTGEAWPHPYAVVTDGRIGIGLHGRELPRSPLLSFVLPDLLHRLGVLEAAGLEVAERRLGGDVFNHALVEAPGAVALRLLEARTFSPVHRGPADASKLGWFEEIALPVADPAAAAPGWERIGFVPTEDGADPYPHVGLTSDTVNVALLAPGTLTRPALVFADEEMRARIAALAAAGVAFAQRLPAGLDPARAALLVAPEGTQILLVAEP